MCDFITKIVIGKEKNAKRASFFWNAAYSGLNACQSAIILLFVSRTMSLVDAGIISIGFALANLAAIIGRYGIRNYQVTDTGETYSFGDYYYCRVLTVAATAAGFLGYLVITVICGSYSSQKALIIFLIILLKLIDAFEGVYVGRLQQRGRLDIGTKIASFRLGVSTLVICVCFLCRTGTVAAFAAGILSALCVDFLLIPLTSGQGNYVLSVFDSQKLFLLVKTVFPLCVGTALHNYIGNAPKYLVDYYMNDEMQAIVGYVMMPMFVITLLNSFIMHPVVKDLGDAWNSGDFSRFQKMCWRHIGIIFGFTVLVVIAGEIAGIPLLSLMYNVDLSMFKKEFGVLMIGGMLYTITNYLIVLLTTMRKLGAIVAGCVASLAVYGLAGGALLRSYGIMGSAILYVIVNAIMVFVFTICIVRGIKKHRNTEDTIKEPTC